VDVSADRSRRTVGRKVGRLADIVAASELDELDRIILEESIHGIVSSGAVQLCRDLNGRMKGQGCDAVVLGCAEIPLIIGDENSPLPTLDSTRLPASAALRRAVAQ
jgi:aspartate racemase